MKSDDYLMLLQEWKRANEAEDLAEMRRIGRKILDAERGMQE